MREERMGVQEKVVETRCTWTLSMSLESDDDDVVSWKA